MTLNNIAVLSKTLGRRASARRVSTASSSERRSRNDLLIEATLAIARGTDSRMEANMAIQDQTTQALSSGEPGRMNARQKTVGPASEPPRVGGADQSRSPWPCSS